MTLPVCVGHQVRGGEAEEALRSDLAGMTVKTERLEQQLREALASVASRDARVTELTRQLDAHRQEHARQSATIVTLRQKLQVGGAGRTRLYVGEWRETRYHEALKFTCNIHYTRSVSVGLTEFIPLVQEEEAACVSLKASQRRGEYTVGALTRETRQAADRISELECRLK